VLTNPELTVVLHALEQSGRADTLSAPRITTMPGVDAEIKVVTEYIYPTEFEVTPVTGTTGGGAGGGPVTQTITGGIVEPSAFETREVGVILQVTPDVSPDGARISLQMSPEVVTEPEWFEYGSVFTDAQGNQTVLSMRQPFFHSRRLTTTITIYDGATVVMGGMITEAMTTVDVNTGAFVGKRDLEDTIYRTNLEAASAIPRQLRLRNIGGIVIIDFIDMVDEEHKRQVLRTLEKGQQSDRVKCNITQISELGLVEMTRKRTYGSLLKLMCEPCSVCDGRGFIKSAESVCLEIFKNVQRRAREVEGKRCLIMASQTVVDRLVDEDAETVRQLAQLLDTGISYQVEPGYTQEQYDVVVSLAEQARIP
jgi:hypothetical protein